MPDAPKGTSPEDRIQLESSWKARLLGEFEAPYMVSLRQFLLDEKQAGKVIFPPGRDIFAALNHTPFDQVKVVILGQDPYHGPGQAHGLCFSVRAGVDIPPSLQNIYTELARDLGIPKSRVGDLSAWSKRGVLLLNAVLTVEQHKAGAHQGKGWERFTDAIIQRLNDEREHLVFLLWGSYAQAKGKIVDTRKHLVLKAPHPSPLSAYRGFIGCAHFSKANAYLTAHGQAPVDWTI